MREQRLIDKGGQVGSGLPRMDLAMARRGETSALRQG